MLRMLPGSDSLIVPHGGCPTECPVGESPSSAAQGGVKVQQMTKAREPFPESDSTDRHASSPAARLSRIAIDCKLSDTFEYALIFLLGPVAAHVNATLPYICNFYRDSLFNRTLLLSGAKIVATARLFKN